MILKNDVGSAYTEVTNEARIRELKENGWMEVKKADQSQKQKQKQKQ